MLAIFNLRDIVELINLYLLDSYSYYILAFIILVVVFYMVRQGIEVNARAALMLFVVFVGSWIFFASLAYMINKPDFLNMLPILEDGIKPMIIPTIKMSYAIPYGQLFSIFIIYQFVRDKKKNYKSGIYGILIAGSVLFTITISNILLVGPKAMVLGSNPTLGIVKLIDYRFYIQRLDLVIINLVLLHVLGKLFVLLFCSKLLIKNVIKIKKDQIITLVTIVVMIASIGLLTNYIKFIYFRLHVNVTYIILTFEVIIPFILVIISFFRKKKGTNNQQMKAQTTQ
jgi:spore germination protein KB